MGNDNDCRTKYNRVYSFPQLKVAVLIEVDNEVRGPGIVEIPAFSDQPGT